ncbi:MAG: hypothetical protein IKV55_01570 [Oscillospiraceae bacterium]|nr:hypothetical protein [Oscillospiraceae bacterium]
MPDDYTKSVTDLSTFPKELADIGKNRRFLIAYCTKARQQMPQRSAKQRGICRSFVLGKFINFPQKVLAFAGKGCKIDFSTHDI